MNEDNLSNLFEKFNINKDSISPEMVNNLMNMLGNNSSNSKNNEQADNNYSQNSSGDSQSTNNIDFETILKMKSIIDKMNAKDDPRSNLLESLKPYLKESRKDKVDQYIKLMNLSKVMEAFTFMGGDSKNASK